VEELDSVPDLEALLLLWQHRSKSWSAADLGRRLYIGEEQTQAVLDGLCRKRLVTVTPGDPETYRYEARSAEQDAMIGRVEAIYRREIVRISTLIHGKPSAAIRDFARAFRFTKEK